MPNSGARPYPLLLEPILLEKVWGGRRLARLGKALPDGRPIGESWEVSDLLETAKGGAGGGAVRSVVSNGAMKGRTLGDCLAAWGQDLVPISECVAAAGGACRSASAQAFPLLVKFLDAHENLSIQVHPSPAFAASHPGANLKTESWYILDADPGAVIYKGVKPGTTRESFARHIADGTVVDDLVAVPAVPGECHNLPSGTCHALGAGVLVAEVQTPSDTTFRVFDWGRTGRELHVAQALDCIDFGPAPESTHLDTDQAEGCHGRLVKTEFFSIDEARLPAGAELPLRLVAGAGRCAVLMVLKGAVVLDSGPADFDAIRLGAGGTCVIPAAIAEGARIDSVNGSRVLLACVPG